MDWLVLLFPLLGSFVLIQETFAQVFSFEASEYSAFEASGRIDVIITRSTSGTADTVDITSGGIILLSMNSITFLAGDTSVELPILFQDNDFDNPDIVDTLTLSNPTSGSIGSIGTTTVSVLDDDDGPVDQVPVWSPWSAWSSCSVTCGSGERTRSRTCTGGNTCQGDSDEMGSCDTGTPCDTDPVPVWSSWSIWSSCSVTCGSGERTRSRTCTGGNTCQGTSEGTDTCDTGTPCDTDQLPFWSQWGAFTSCTVTCGGGTQTRSRICVDSNQQDDLTCTPASDEQESSECNTQTCIESGVWNPWGQWGVCSVSCGDGGSQSRTRTCSTSSCSGSNTDTRICSAQSNCPEWNTWEQWSECSLTCGDGTRVRSRSCNDFGTGASCEGSNARDETCSLEDCPEFCESGIEVTPYGGLRSPGNQPVGTTHVASAVCPWYTRNEGSPIGSATCVLRNGETFWEWIWDCGGDLDFDELSERPITPDNADEILDMLDDMTRSPDDIEPEDVSNVIEILGDIVDLQLPYRELTDSVIDIVDNLCQVDPDVLMAAQSMDPPTCEAVGVVEGQLKNVQVNRPDIGDWPYRRVVNNIGAEAYEASNDDLCQGIYVATSQGSEASSNGLLMRERQASTNIDAEIDVPGDICNQYPGGARVILDVFVGDKLLPSRDLQDTNDAQNDYNRVVNSPVISVTVGDQEVQNLQEPVRLLFTPLETHANNTECVFFDFNRKDWSSEGCTYLGETPNWQRICECDHLTNFALLMDIYGGYTITKTQAFILEILTYVGCCLSIIGCAVTLMTYCSSSKLKSKRPNQILMALTATLMCLYIAFIILISIDTERGKAELHVVACSILAGIVHYFTLSSLFWMAVEAYNMYLMFVKVINSYVPNLLLKAAAFAWGVPLIIVAATGAAARGDYARTDFCFLHTWPLVGGVLAPIGIILIFNIVIFVIVIIRLSRESPGSRLQEQRKALRVRRVRNAICIMTLMGLTWIIGYLSIIKSVSFISQLIFCLLNAMQGYVIFMCYCVQQPAVRNHWRESLGTIRKDSSYRGSSSRDGTGRDVFVNSNRRHGSSSDNAFLVNA